MADFFTHFSCVLDVGTPDNAARALDLYSAFGEEAGREDVPPDGFLLSIQPEHGGTTLWIRDEVTGDPRYFNSNLVAAPFSTWAPALP